MEIRRLLPGSTGYPRGLRGCGAEHSPVLSYLGNSDLLRLPLIGVLSSADIPPDLVLPSLDLVLRLRDLGAATIGGFQSRLESECLGILLRGSQPLVVCPARAIEGMKVSERWAERLEAGSMLVLSRFRSGLGRPSVRLAMQRNALVTTVAERLLVTYAGPGSRAIRAAAAAIEMGKRVYCFDHPRNRDLLLLGAWPLDPAPGRPGADRELLTPASPSSR